MSVVFFGTSKYCLPVLEALKPQLKLVVVMPDRPVGRKQILTPCATKQWAISNGIEIASSLAPRNDIDVAIVADYGRIIPREEFVIPKLGTFNIHFSKLPDLRGASPVQQTILRGDTTAWVTIFKIAETLDTGPILDQRSFSIFPYDTTESLYSRLFVEVSKYITTLDFSKKLALQSGTPTYCKLLTRQDGFVELDDPQIYNKFRAYFPWPGIWSIKNGKRMKILKCHPDKNKIIIDLLQYEGEKPKIGL